MKGRFPRDVLAIVFGPIFVLVFAVGLSSLIFHAQQLRGSVVGYSIVAAGIVVLVGMLLLRGRRRH
jgi:hypothetical protein